VAPGPEGTPLPPGGGQNGKNTGDEIAGATGARSALQCIGYAKSPLGSFGYRQDRNYQGDSGHAARPVCEIAAIASRDGAKAEEVAGRLGIPKAYGSYEEMLDDPGIEAIYNPLPNHMHVPWSIRAAEAGKHVLCEKPVGMNVAETLELMAARDRTGVVMGEAFMIQSHPQWLRTVELVRTGRIGQLRFAVGSFSYFKLDAGNIRNIREYGGGGLMDIGCYAIKTSRMVFGEEPTRVSAAMVRDPRFGNIDMLTSVILDYPSGHCNFHLQYAGGAATEHAVLWSHGAHRAGDSVHPLENGPSRIRIDDGRDLTGSGVTVEEFPACDQYTIQGDLFSRAIRAGVLRRAARRRTPEHGGDRRHRPIRRNRPVGGASREIGNATAPDGTVKKSVGRRKRQCRILFPEPGIRRELWGRFLTCGGLVTARIACKQATSTG